MGDVKTSWDQCEHCGCYDAYMTKAVPRKIFLSILIGNLLMVLFLFQYGFFYAFIPLVVITIGDAVLYRVLPNMLVCYRCERETRQIKHFTNLSRFKPYDPHIMERNRKR